MQQERTEEDKAREKYVLKKRNITKEERKKSEILHQRLVDERKG